MKEYDQPLVWVTILLMLLGMVMVYSASISLPDSPRFANYVRWQNTYFLQRQAMFVVVSLVIGLFVFRTRIATLQKWAPYLFIGTLVLLLVLVLVAGQRWWELDELGQRVLVLLLTSHLGVGRESRRWADMMGTAGGGHRRVGGR